MQQRRDLCDSRLIQTTCCCKRARGWIVNFRRVESMDAVGAAADYKHASVAKHRSGMTLARCRHRSSRAERPARRIVDLGAREFRAKTDIASAAGYQHASVAEHRDRMTFARDGHRASRDESMPPGIAQLRTRDHAADV